MVNEKNTLHALNLLFRNYYFSNFKHIFNHKAGSFCHVVLTFSPKKKRKIVPSKRCLDVQKQNDNNIKIGCGQELSVLFSLFVWKLNFETNIRIKGTHVRFTLINKFELPKERCHLLTI